MRPTLGLSGVVGGVGVKLALEVLVAESIGVELAGQEGFEEGDMLRSDRVESRATCRPGLLCARQMRSRTSIASP